ncbi:MAG: GNAT family N-acetyltransferase [Saprospiraceae bacterium]|nr:GNAT family N-acetyltransferase [Saprospiraceae bacterium]
MKIIPAGLTQIDDLLPLFDAYRQFYGMTSDLVRAKAFLEARFNNQETTIFMAYENGQSLGFLTLYPTFSSVSMKGDFLLNDLFVHADARGRGIGAALLKKAQEFALQTNAKGLLLETALDNPAQFLYEKMGFKKTIEGVYHYYWKSPV